jgi:hypothetical protein
MTVTKKSSKPTSMTQEAYDVFCKIKSGEMPIEETIADVGYAGVTKNAHMFHFYAVYRTKGRLYDTFLGVDAMDDNWFITEIFYDLRNRECYIKNNGHHVNFSIANLDVVIPRKRDGYRIQEMEFFSQAGVEKFFHMVEVPQNEGMYSMMLSIVGELGEERVKMTSRSLIRLIGEYHKLELLYKAGFTTRHILAQNISAIRKMSLESEGKSNKLHDLFGLSKSTFRFLNNYHPNFNPFEGEVTAYEMLPSEEVNKLANYVKLVRQLADKYGLDPEDKVREFLSRAHPEELLFLYAKKHVEPEILKEFPKGVTNAGHPVNQKEFITQFSTIEFALMTKYNGLKGRYLPTVRGHTDYRVREMYYYKEDFHTFVENYGTKNTKRLIEYLLFECDVSQALGFPTALSEYKDYYRMCTELGYQNFEKYPKYLRTAHDIVTRNHRTLQDEIDAEKWRTIVEGYTHLECKNKDFVITLPKKPKDLAKEGDYMGHCVGGYAKNVLAGRCMIAFFRKATDPDTPFITLELRAGAIVQAKMKGNVSPPSKLKEAITELAEKNNILVKRVT